MTARNGHNGSTPERAYAVTQRALRKLEPYLVGKPNDTGEWEMMCPTHEDPDPSASLNIHSGIVNCFVCGGGPVGQLLDKEAEWLPPVYTNGSKPSPTRNGGKQEDLPTMSRVKGWHAALTDNIQGKLEDFMTRRGLNEQTIKDRLIGYDIARMCYTIPVLDRHGALTNVRRYRPDESGSRKMRGITGHNDTSLYPVDQLVHQTIIICEGELDALVWIQCGFAAITRTNGGRAWRNAWSPLFSGKTVYVCHDADTAGEEANHRVGRHLRNIANEILVVRLPFAVTADHGKDTTDLFLERGESELRSALERALPWGDPRTNPTPVETKTGKLSDAFDAEHARKPLRFSGAVTGRAGKSYLVPKRIRVVCSPDAEGSFCDTCPLSEVRGRREIEISQDDPVLLALLDVKDQEKNQLIRRKLGLPPKCFKTTIDIVEERNATGMMVRATLDYQMTAEGDQRPSDLKSERIIYLGPPADINPGETLQFEGALHPNPQSQAKEFMAWAAYREETSLDRFDITPHRLRILMEMRPNRGQRPLDKVLEISRDLEAITRIYGREWMQAAMLLVLYSGVSFRFEDDLIKRGWVEGLIIGDSRSGKSKAAQRLVEYCQAGVMVPGEGASYAGLFGGDKVVYGRQWDFSYGLFPINDRRAVILDEVSGLPVDEIGKMSSARSEGRVQITKIESGEAFARTRSLWLSNPRSGALSQFTRGIDALPSLIGNPEDIARFTFAMAIRHNQQVDERINRSHVARAATYTAEHMRTLREWAWSRQAGHVTWSPAAAKTVYTAAKVLGQRYVPDPPLIQAADVREKIMRIAVALANLTFSTVPDDHDQVLIRQVHVRDAVRFLETVYEDEAFGYRQRSEELIHDRKVAERHSGKIEEWLHHTRGMAPFLRQQSGKPFTARELGYVFGVDEITARAWVTTLATAKMVSVSKRGVEALPPLNDILRRVAE